MAVQARLYHGTPIMIDHTPTGAVVSGDVVLVGDIPCIAHLDIPANRKGALGAGRAVYQVAGDAAIAIGKKVYWVDATNKVSESAAAGANKAFGWTVTACTGDTALCYVMHQPQP